MIDWSLDAGSVRSAERALARRARQQPSRIGIEHVAMDAFVPYINAVEQVLPETAQKITFGKLHIVMRLGDAANAMHLAEHQALLA